MKDDAITAEENYMEENSNLKPDTALKTFLSFYLSFMPIMGIWIWKAF